MSFLLVYFCCFEELMRILRCPVGEFCDKCGDFEGIMWILMFCNWLLLSVFAFWLLGFCFYGVLKIPG
jgi:hypothetical protein